MEDFSGFGGSDRDRAGEKHRPQPRDIAAWALATGVSRHWLETGDPSGPVESASSWAPWDSNPQPTESKPVVLKLPLAQGFRARRLTGSAGLCGAVWMVGVLLGVLRRTGGAAVAREWAVYFRFPGMIRAQAAPMRRPAAHTQPTVLVIESWNRDSTSTTPSAKPGISRLR